MAAAGLGRTRREPIGAAEIDPQRVRMVYDRALDLLSISFVGETAPAVSYAAGDYTALRVDPRSNKMVGIEVERFLAHGIYTLPEPVLGILDNLGLSAKEAARIRARYASKRALGVRERFRSLAQIGRSILPIPDQPHSETAAQQAKVLAVFAQQLLGMA